jgi:hypothetical protein
MSSNDLPQCPRFCTKVSIACYIQDACSETVLWPRERLNKKCSETATCPAVPAQPSLAGRTHPKLGLSSSAIPRVNSVWPASCCNNRPPGQPQARTNPVQAQPHGMGLSGLRQGFYMQLAERLCPMLRNQAPSALVYLASTSSSVPFVNLPTLRLSKPAQGKIITGALHVASTDWLDEQSQQNWEISPKPAEGTHQWDHVITQLVRRVDCGVASSPPICQASI